MDNLAQVYDQADGIFVASCLKDTGNMTGNLDKHKLDQFMKIYNEVVSKNKKG